ncbi:hypothetical protein ScPMuIL_003312 [Solemya velum]
MLAGYGYRMFVLVLLFATISAYNPIACRKQYQKCLLKNKSEIHCELQQLGCFRNYCERTAGYTKTAKRARASLLACFLKYGILMLIPDA